MRFRVHVSYTVLVEGGLGRNEEPYLEALKHV